MAHEKHEKVDAVTGVATTGHSWDDIEELNNPLPRWWLWTFYLCIVWAIAYCIAYPAWPLVSSYTKGALGWHSRDAVEVELAALKDQRSGMTAKHAATYAEVADGAVFGYGSKPNADMDLPASGEMTREFVQLWRSGQAAKAA